MSEVASAYVSLIPSFRGGAASIANALGGSTDRAGRDAGRRYGTGLLGGIGGMSGKITALVGGMLAFKGVSSALGFAKDAMFGFNSQLEQSKIAFTTMLGSGTKAQAFLDKLKTFARSTPFEFPDLVTASQRLIAMGISSKDVVPYLTSIGDAVSGLGGGKDKIDQVTTAIGQMSAKGKIQSDELLQLTEAGIPALKILADQYHKTPAAMQEMITAGDVMSADALPKLMAGLEHGTKTTAAFGGMMAKQSQTFGGAMSNIKDSLTQSLASAFLPFFRSTSKGLQRFAGFLSGPTFAAASAKFTAILSSGMGAAVTLIGRIAPIAKRVFEGVLVPAFNAARALLPHLVTSFSNLWAAAKPLATVIGGALFGAFKVALVVVRQLGPVLDNVTGFIKANKTWIGALVVGIGSAVAVWKLWQLGIAAWSAVTRIAGVVQAAFNGVLAANPVMLVVIAIAALAAGLIYAYKQSATFRAIVKAAFNGVKTAAQAVANFFTKDIPRAFFAVGRGLKTAWDKAVGFLKTWGPVALSVLVPFIGIPLLIWQHWSAIKGFLVRVWNAVWPYLKTWGPVALSVLVPFIGIPLLIWQHWSTIKGFLVRVWNAVWPYLKKWGPLALSVLVPFIGIPLLIWQHWSTIKGFLVRVWNAVWPFLKKWGPAALAVLVPFIGIPLLIWQHFGKIKGFLTSAFNGAKQAVSNGISNIVSNVASLPGKIAGLAGRLASAGRSFIGGLFTGIKGALTGAGRWAGDLGSSIVNSVKNALNNFLHLPLRLPRINTHIPGVGTVGGQTLIPKLAKGGIIPATPGGRLVRVAEAGQAEAVIPLDKLGALGGGGGNAPLIGSLSITEVTDTVGTANAVSRRLALLGA